MTKLNKHDESLSEVHQSVDTTRKLLGFRKIFAFLGPAYMVSVGYMDPGNWATDLAGGSKFGYSLIWVLLMSNLMALLLQGFSARLGIVRGRDLAQANRETYPRAINFALYILAEIAIAATDLAEVLGMAIGLHLLSGHFFNQPLPLLWGVIITVLDTFILLFLQRLGIRKMEAFIIALVAIVGISFLIEIILAQPPMGEVVKGFAPSLPNDEALYIAIGIIGATVMPHNLYLHSALVQTRKIDRTDFGIKQAIKFNRIDSTIALNIAFFVNAAILVLAATVFWKTGRQDVAEIKEAHHLLDGLLGTKLAPILFAVALIAAGQSSTITGTLAGQIVMEGYLSLRINPWIRRLLTRLVAIIPAVIVIVVFGDEKIDALLVLSQVILSLQLGFAIIPLIHFVSNKEKMGKFTINNLQKTGGWLIAAILVSLNLKMIWNEISGVFPDASIGLKILIVAGSLLFIGLLLFVIIQPLIIKKPMAAKPLIHPEIKSLEIPERPVFNRIAIALDFSEHDSKLIAFALGQGKPGSAYLLIHIVESAGAKMLGKDSYDLETQKDFEQLENYAKQLNEKGYNAIPLLGFRNRKKEITRLVTDNNADILVIGAHGHTGLKDLLYGETVNAVRHELKIPVLVVHL